MEWDRRYPAARNLGYLARETKRGCAKLLIYCPLIVLINIVIPVLGAYLPKVVIDALTLGWPLGRLLPAAACRTCALALLSGAQKNLDRLIYWNKFSMNACFLRQVVRKGLTTDYRNQEDERFRTLQEESFASCNGNYSHFAQTYDVAVRFCSGLLGFLAFAGILSALGPALIAFLCLTTIGGFLLNRAVARWLEDHLDEKAGYERRMQYVVRSADDTRAAKDIRLYAMAAWLNGIYEDNKRGLLGWYRRYTEKLFGAAAAGGALALLREGAACAFLLYLALRGRITGAEFVLYFQAVTGFSTWLGGLLGQAADLKRLNIAINRFRSFLEYPESYLREGGKSPERADTPGRIELRGVRFRYAPEGEDVIRDLSLTVEPGEHLAVVGLNGAGKTTLVKLICALTEATGGSVLYDGIDVREYNRGEYYRLFGAVFQDHSLLPTSIERIVAEGEDAIDGRRVEECLKKAGLWEKISSLPGGVSSLFDSAFWEDGISLSGGETQKLLLARALYRNAPIIVLDEPTAALDPVSENRLYETYDEVMRGKTAFFISHRLASTRFCHRIVLIENGRIAEEGSHEELLARNGRYRELFEAQAKYYRESAREEAGGDEA